MYIICTVPVHVDWTVYPTICFHQDRHCLCMVFAIAKTIPTQIQLCRGTAFRVCTDWPSPGINKQQWKAGLTLVTGPVSFKTKEPRIVRGQQIGKSDLSPSVIRLVLLMTPTDRAWQKNAWHIWAGELAFTVGLGLCRGRRGAERLGQRDGFSGSLSNESLGQWMVNCSEWQSSDSLERLLLCRQMQRCLTDVKYASLKCYKFHSVIRNVFTNTLMAPTCTAQAVLKCHTRMHLNLVYRPTYCASLDSSTSWAESDELHKNPRKIIFKYVHSHTVHVYVWTLLYIPVHVCVQYWLCW
jgi:hypothetical protein